MWKLWRGWGIGFTISSERMGRLDLTLLGQICSSGLISGDLYFSYGGELGCGIGCNGE